MVILRLNGQHETAMYKLIAAHHLHGASILGIHAFKDYFLEDRDGYAIACTEDDGRITQLFLSGVEDTTFVTKNIFGQFGSWTVEIINMLVGCCAKMPQPITEHMFLLTTANYDEFVSAFKNSRLRNAAVEESQLRGGVRATDKFMWEKALSKNIPLEDVLVYKVTV